MSSGHPYPSLHPGTPLFWAPAQGVVCIWALSNLLPFVPAVFQFALTPGSLDSSSTSALSTCCVLGLIVASESTNRNITPFFLVASPWEEPVVQTSQRSWSLYPSVLRQCLTLPGEIKEGFLEEVTLHSHPIEWQR